jgi:hypothetical protein
LRRRASAVSKPPPKDPPPPVVEEARQRRLETTTEEPAHFGHRPGHRHRVSTRARLGARPARPPKKPHHRRTRRHRWLRGSPGSTTEEAPTTEEPHSGTCVGGGSYRAGAWWGVEVTRWWG